MRKLFLFSLLLLGASLSAQVPVYGNGITYTYNDPGAGSACAAGSQNVQVISTGVLYACPSTGLLQVIGGGSGGGPYLPLAPFSSNLPASFWGVGDGVGAANPFVQNQTALFTFTLDVPVTVNYIQTYVNTADNTSTNNYDIGIIAQSGTVLFHTGAVHGSAFGVASNTPSLAVTSPGILYPGTYAFAYTTNCASSCLVLENSVAAPFGFATNSGGVTSGGVLTNISAFAGYNGGHWSAALATFILHQ